MSVPQATFHHHPFTSTLHDIKHNGKIKGKNNSFEILFNPLIVVMTAMFFFMVLSWYNFILAIYNYITYDESYGKEGISGSNIPTLKTVRHEVGSNLGFALLWTLIVFVFYLVLDYYGIFTKVSNDTVGHPLLRESSNLSDTSDVGEII